MQSELWQVFTFGGLLNKAAMPGDTKEQQAHAAVEAVMKAAMDRLEQMGLTVPVRLQSAEVDEVAEKIRPHEVFWQVEIKLECVMPLPLEVQARIPVGEGKN